MATIPLTAGIVSAASDRGKSLRLLILKHRFHGADVALQSCADSRPRRFRICCQGIEKEENPQIRRFPPLLESTLLSGDGHLPPTEWNAVPDIWRSSAEKFGDRIALVDPYHEPPSNITYNQLEQEILNFAEGLRVIGVNPEEKVALFADNSCRWLVADQGLMATGAINVVRGSRSSVEELLQIYNHSESIALVVDGPDLFSQIAVTLCSKASVRFVILLWGEKSCLAAEEISGIPVFSYKEIIDLGYDGRETLFHSKDARLQYSYEAISSDDIATLVYTSGTTGSPRGVMLTHRNLLHQIRNFWDIVPAVAGDKFLSMLPPWHAYERACEYFIFTHGIEQVYTTVKKLKDDLRFYRPEYLISVPLVYETLYSAIQKQISLTSTAHRLVAVAFLRISMTYMQLKRIYEGKCLSKNEEQSYLISMLDCVWAKAIATILQPIHMLAKMIIYNKIQAGIGIYKAGISGGGSLPVHVDRFFEAIDIKLQNGYGLTEASPVIAARLPNCNVLGSVGHPLRETKIKIVDSETGEALSHGSKGIVMVKGPQVMKGYYKNPLATMQVLDESHWLSTGDIGWLAPYQTTGRSRLCGGMLVLEGRAKDTIVLSTGENVEPSELEDAATRSPLIQQIVVIGQDQRRLGAIIVPNKTEILMAAKKPLILDSNSADLSIPEVKSLLYEELKTWTSGFSFQIGPILVADEPFTIENGLVTPTMKIRRENVAALYKEQIARLYK